MVTTTVSANAGNYVGYNATTNKIYTVSAASAAMQVIDGATNTVSATINLTMPNPVGVYINSHNNKIYTSHNSYDGVTVIDGTTNTATYIATGTNVSGMAVNPVTDKVYVANAGSNTVTVINGADGVDTNISVGSNPTSVAVNSVTNMIYVANALSNTVSVIDGSSNVVLTTITAGTFPYRLAVNEVTNRVYVTNNSSNNVSVIDGASNSVTATVAVGTNPGFIAVNPASNMVYVINTNSPDITVINGATNTAVTLPISGKSAAINQSTNTIYIVSNNSTLPIIDGATNAVTTVYPPYPTTDIAVNTASNLVYLGNSAGITILNSNQYPLTTSTYSPDFGSGTVTANPVSASYPAGTVVTLKATPALGSYFSGWSGACTGNLSLTCKVTMDGAKSATANFTSTQPTATTWSKSIGSSITDDSFTAVQQTADGGYIMAGSYGYNGGVSQDFWVVKMNADGSVAWQNRYNGYYGNYSLNGNESAASIQQTADGGYILAGTTQINGGSRGWILRLDSAGNHIWNKPIGSDDGSSSSFSSVQQTSDGGFIATGSANSNIWLVKLASTGVIEWQKGVLSGYGKSVIQTSDDGYIVAGGALLTKFSADGSAIWQSQLSGVTMTSVVQNLDGSYAVAGYSAVASAGGNDVWVAKLDATGSVITWQKSLGGSGNEYGTSLQQTTDGGYIIGGYSDTLGAGAQDILLIKLDSTGALQGSQTYGGTSFDSGAAVQQTADGGYILVGQTYVGTAMYKNDGWAMKLDGTGLMAGCEASAILTPVLTAVNPGITIVQSAISSSNVTNKSAAVFSTAPIDTSLSTATTAVCYSAPGITIPTGLTFGTPVYPATSSTQNLTITNSGTANLTISAITVPLYSYFSLNPGDGTGGSCGTLTPVIAAGASCTIAITFTPGYAGLVSDSLTITSNDTARPTASVALSGMGGYLLTINNISSSAGVITGACFDGCAIQCGTSNTGTSSSCSYRTMPGNITLTETPMTGAIFTGWSGSGVNCPGNGTCTVAVTSDMTVDVGFCTAGSYTITPKMFITDFNSASSSLSVAPSTGSCTGWTAGSDVPWITVNTGGNGSGSGTVGYSVIPGNQLHGTVTAAGQTLDVLRTGTAGGLDTTFNSTPASAGYALLSKVLSSTDQFTINALATQSDGKIVVTGNRTPLNNTTTTTLFVARFLSNGALDTGFATGGVFVYANPTGNSIGNGIAFQVDGKIVVTGNRRTSSYMTAASRFADEVMLFRLDATTGALDTSFNTAGAEPGISFFSTGPTSDTEGHFDHANSVAIDPVSGNIVVAGSTEIDYGTFTGVYWYFSSQNFNAMVIRFDTTGALDPAFNYSGYMLFGSNASFKSATVQPDQSVVAVGSMTISYVDNLLVARFTSSGAYDSSFNGGLSYRNFAYQPSRNTNGSGIILDSSGRILVTGYGGNNSYGMDGLLLRLDTSGLLDTTFNGSGVATVGGTSNYYMFTAPALQNDGKIVVAGSVVSTGEDMLAVRFNSDGSQDGTFGVSGSVTFRTSSSYNVSSAIKVTPAGKIVLAGNNALDGQIVSLQSISPAISVSPGSYNFGTVPVGGNATWPLTISNLGTVPLNVASINISGSEYSLNTAGGTNPCNSATPTLAPATSCTVTVTVAPTTPGFKGGTVIVTSDDPARPSITASFTAKTSPQTIAYIYDTDTVLRDEFNTFLTGLGYSVTTVQMTAAETYNFSTTDLILISHDTSGFFSIPSNGSNWGTPTAVSNISSSNRPILGLGFGGTSFFGNIGLFINWGNSWNGNDKDISVVNPAHAFFTTPKPVTGTPVSLYSIAPAEVGIYMPTTQPGVTPLGMEFTDTTLSHYSLIQQRTANQVYTLWGFGGSPVSMTTDGQNLFANILYSYAPTPAVITPNYSITASATPSIGGSITPAGSSSVLSGGSLAFAITPFTGYHIADVTVDGISQGAITAYTFSNITANHTIDALFAPDTGATAFTVSGSVNYTGSKSGRIYVTVFTSNGPMGTSLTAPGNFTIQGVPAGTYPAVTAFMDVLGTGSRHESDPAGLSSSITVATGNVTGVSINMTDPSQLTTVLPPTGLQVFPADSAALVQWKQLDTGNGSQADSYSLYWDASPNPVPGSTTGSRLDIPATGDKNDLLLGGLTNGTYYFVLTAKSGTVTSAPSAVYGPVTIGTPVGGYSVSGTVTFPAVANGKPLYLAIGDKNNNLYPAYIAAATSPQTYTVSGVPNGSYRVFGIIDVDNNGLIGIGDYKSNDLNAPFITVNNSALVNTDLIIGSENAGVRVMTQHWKASTLDMYGLNFELFDGLKRPVTVRLNGGPNVTGPIDVGLNKGGGFYSIINLNTATPAVNDTYTFDIAYSDGSSETISGKVTGVVNDFATPTAPTGSVSFNATPVFTWTAPASQPVNGSYVLQLQEANGPTNSLFWDSNQIPLNQTSVVFNFDNRASQTVLTNGKSYNWGVMVSDQQGNFSASYTSFNFPGEVSLTPALYDFGTVPVGGSATWPLTINNNGSSPVSVYGISVSGTDFTLDYTGGANPCNSPYPLIAAGANCSLNVIINPTTAGLKNATVTVTSNNSLTPTLTAAFSATAVNFTITAPTTPNPGGFISPPGTTTLASGGSMLYYITPNTGYHIADVKVDGVSQGAITSYTFSNVTANHTIDAIFAINSADISGTISYSGSKTGRIYITLQPSGPTQPNNGMLGTSIAAPGAFTIRGVPDGSYAVKAFMDSLDLGTQVQVSPSGTTAATVAGSNLTGLSITLTDPTPAAPAAPVNLTASPGNSSLLMDWDKQRSNGIEPADAYDIYWGTSAGVSKVSNSGSRLNVPAGFDSPLVIDGLINGDKLYFIVIAKSGGVESGPSAPIGPFTIGAPTGGYTVSGTLSYSGPPATGPLYIAIVNPLTKGAAGIFYTKIAAPAASNNFTVTGVLNGDYVIYSIIDMNNDGLFGIGDVMTPDNQAPAITVNGAALTGVTVALTGMNGEASITTDHNKSASGPGEFFNVEGSVSGQLKRPVTVTLTAAPATIGIPLPMDLGLDGKDGSGNFRFWTGSSARPAIGDTYTFTVTYADGTIDTTATAAVTGVSDSFPTNPQIAAPVTTVPIFSWGPPATPPTTYSYSVWVGAVNSTDIWDAWDLPSSINSITYGATGSSAQPLLIGSSYYWHVSTKDPKGNRASIGSSFVPANQGAPLIFWPAPAAIPLGTALSAAELNATASVPGTFSYTPAAGTVLAAGAQTLTVNFTPTDSTNFTAATATVTLNVNPVITATAGSGGSITPAEVTMVTSGGTQPYAITPTTGYHIVDVKIDGVSQGAISSYTFSSVTTNHTIDASFALDTFFITATASAGGTVSPAGTTMATYGSSQTYAIAPAISYHIVDVKIDGVSQGAIAAYTFSNIASSHTIDITFAIDTFSITATANSGGVISPAGATIAAVGSNQAYVIAATTGYHIVDVKVDGVSQGVITAYTFSNVTANHTIDAAFAIDSFTITATASAGGSLTPPGATVASYGSNQAYTITTATGYHVTDVKVDGVSQGAVTAYTFNNVTAGHTIDATFAVDTFTITATANSGGTISPVGATTLNFGASQSYTITPDAGFVLIDVRVDQVSIGKVTSYAFINLASGHTIEAIFGADGVVDPANTTGIPQLGDALIVLTAALGDATLTPAQIKKVDTMPISNGVPQPDGKIDLLDVLVMLRRIVGLEKW